jgi:hypothetical protein
VVPGRQFATQRKRVDLGSRLVADGGFWIQLRDGIEKVVWEGRPYYRTVWQDVRRLAPRRVRESEGRVLCSLCALGVDVEDHLRIDPESDAVEVLDPPPVIPGVILAPPAVLPGVAAAVAARSAPALGPFIMQVAAGLTLEWGPVARDLVALEGTRLRVSSRLLPLVRARLSAGSTSDEVVDMALDVVSELAHLVGDPVRARAQADLAAQPPDAHLAALDTARGVDTVASARAISSAVRALMG